MKGTKDDIYHCIGLIVLPQKLRSRILTLAHEKCGHFDRKKVMDLVKRKFLWPQMSGDVNSHCRSCQQCQRNKFGPKKSPSQSQKSVPFEKVAVDLVGPLEKSKSGYRFLLTYVCMATRWPEAIPLKPITARAVLDGLLEIFSRNGIPRELLSDQGKQFTGKSMKDLCSMYGIDKIQTSTYRPQSNGVVERLHGTLIPMLKKNVEKKQDWVKQLPMALYALRFIPNCSTGVCPFEFIHGRHLHSPVDLVYSGWVNKDTNNLDVSTRAEELAERIELIRDFACVNQTNSTEKRKNVYDKGSAVRAVEVGDLVMVRTPGLQAKLRSRGQVHGQLWRSVVLSHIGLNQ